MKNLLLITLALGVVSCAMPRTKVLDTAAISMTHDSIQPGTELMVTGPVTAEFCTSMSNDKGDIGLMDEATKKAQTQHQVDYILNASFWATGGCMQVEGQGAKVVTSNTTTAKKKLKK